MNQFLNNFTNFGLNDILDVLIVAFIFYKFLIMMRETRAETLIKGIIIILIVWRVAEMAEFRMLTFIIRNMMTLGFVALVIVFQPELRKGLDYLGRNKFFKKFSFVSEENGNDGDIVIFNIVDAVLKMSKEKIGALIVIERENSLSEISMSGVELDAQISSDLIRNIFFKNSPLHDGAMIIKDGRIKAASCILPLTDKIDLSNDLGTRHRAALGISENSDVLVLIVSEENGVISFSHEGKLSRFLDKNSLISILKSKLKPSETSKTRFVLPWRRQDAKEND